MFRHWALSLLALVGLALARAFEAEPKAAPKCLATPVEGNKVRAGGFVGYIAPTYDDVEGRFRLHVGSFRDRAIGLSQKIPWFANPRAGTAGSLAVVGTRLGPRPLRQFRQSFRSSSRRVFPTIISPPLPGCWRLEFTSGRVQGSLVALVND